MGFYKTNKITITDSVGAIRAQNLPLQMDPKNDAWQMQVQGLIPTDIYDCESIGWSSPVPKRSDYIIDQKTGIKYSMFSTVFVGQNSIQFKVTKYSGVTP